MRYAQSECPTQTDARAVRRYEPIMPIEISNKLKTYNHEVSQVFTHLPIATLMAQCHK